MGGCCSQTKIVHWFCLQSCKLEAVFSGHTKGVQCLTVIQPANSQPKLITGSFDCSVIVHDTKVRQPLRDSLMSNCSLFCPQTCCSHHLRCRITTGSQRQCLLQESCACVNSVADFLWVLEMEPSQFLTSS